MTRKEKHRENARRGRAANPAKDRVASKRYRERHTFKAKQTIRQWRYGLSLEVYNALSLAHEGRCAICRDVPREGLDIDHSHDTKQVRGLLCKSCNTGLGAFRDNVGLLAAAISYLTREVKPWANRR